MGLQNSDNLLVGRGVASYRVSMNDFTEYLSAQYYDDFIPLSGTIDGAPVTGDVVFENGKKIIFGSNNNGLTIKEGYWGGLYYGDALQIEWGVNGMKVGGNLQMKIGGAAGMAVPADSYPRGRITSLGDPIGEFDAVHRLYVDSGLAVVTEQIGIVSQDLSNYLPLSGGTLTGHIESSSNIELHEGSLVLMKGAERRWYMPNGLNRTVREYRYDNGAEHRIDLENGVTYKIRSVGSNPLAMISAKADGSLRLRGLSNPSFDDEPANKAYVDGLFDELDLDGNEAFDDYLPKAGGTMSGTLTLNRPGVGAGFTVKGQDAAGNAIDLLQAYHNNQPGTAQNDAINYLGRQDNPNNIVTNSYVTDHVAGVTGDYLPLTGGTTTGELIVTKPTATESNYLFSVKSPHMEEGKQVAFRVVGNGQVKAGHDKTVPFMAIDANDVVTKGYLDEQNYGVADDFLPLTGGEVTGELRLNRIPPENTALFLQSGRIELKSDVSLDALNGDYTFRGGSSVDGEQNHITVLTGSGTTLFDIKRGYNLSLSGVEYNGNITTEKNIVTKKYVDDKIDALGDVLNFKGAIDFTVATAPADATVGDVYANNADGAADESWGLDEDVVAGQLFGRGINGWALIGGTNIDLTPYATTVYVDVAVAQRVPTNLLALEELP